MPCNSITYLIYSIAHHVVISISPLFRHLGWPALVSHLPGGQATNHTVLYTFLSWFVCWCEWWISLMCLNFYLGYARLLPPDSSWVMSPIWVLFSFAKTTSFCYVTVLKSRDNHQICGKYGTRSCGSTSVRALHFIFKPQPQLNSTPIHSLDIIVN